MKRSMLITIAVVGILCCALVPCSVLAQDGSLKATSAAKDIDFGPYMRAVQDKIKSNWHKPKNIWGERKANVTFTINSDGSIVNPVLDKSSGDATLDQTCLDALKDLAFDKLPDGAPSQVQIQFSFDYSGPTSPDDLKKKIEELSQPGQDTKLLVVTILELGDTYRFIEKMKEAEAEYKKALSVAEAKFGAASEESQMPREKLIDFYKSDKTDGKNLEALLPLLEAQIKVDEARTLRQPLRDHLLVLAEALMQQGQYTKAEEVLKRDYQLYLTEFPESNDVQKIEILLKECFKHSGNGHQGVEWLRSNSKTAHDKVIQQKETDLAELERSTKATDRAYVPRVQLDLARLYCESEVEPNFARAEQLYQKALSTVRTSKQDSVKSDEVLVLFGNCFYKQKKYNDAIRLYEEALASRVAEHGKGKRDVIEHMYYLAEVMAKHGDSAQAERLYEQALDLALKNSKSPSDHLAEAARRIANGFARLQFNQGKFTAAAETLKRAGVSYVTPTANFNLEHAAMCFLKANQKESAKAMYEVLAKQFASEHPSDHAYTLYELAQFQLTANDIPQSVQSLKEELAIRQSLKDSNTSLRAMLNLAEVEQKASGNTEAEKMLKRAVAYSQTNEKVRGDYLIAVAALADFYWKQGKYNLAFPYVEQEFALSSGESKVLAGLRLGWLYVDSGKLDKAGQLWTALLKAKNDKHPLLSRHLGALCELQKKPGEAEQYYLREHLNRSSIDLDDKLIQLYLRQQDFSKAMKTANALPDGDAAASIIALCLSKEGKVETSMQMYRDLESQLKDRIFHEEPPPIPLSVYEPEGDVPALTGETAGSIGGPGDGFEFGSDPKLLAKRHIIPRRMIPYYSDAKGGFRFEIVPIRPLHNTFEDKPGDFSVGFEGRSVIARTALAATQARLAALLKQQGKVNESTILSDSVAKTVETDPKVRQELEQLDLQ